MTMTTSNLERVGTGTTDGLQIGPTNDSAGNPYKIGFFGTTPQSKYAALATQNTSRLGEVRMHLVPASTGPHSYSSAPEETMTCSSMAANSCVYIGRSSTTPGIAIAGYRVSAADTFGVTLLNVSTAATVVPVSTQAYQIVEFRANGGFVTTVVWTPAAVAASTTAEQSVTVPGAMPGQLVIVNKPTAQTALGIANARVSAASTVAVAFANISSASITPTAAETYTFALVPNLHAASPIVQYSVPVTTIAAAVTVSTTVEQTTTLMNLAATDMYLGNTLVAQQAGVFPVNGRVNSSGVLGLTWGNVSSGALTPTTSDVMGITILRPEPRPAVQLYSTTFPATTVPASTTVEYSTTVTGLLTSSIVFVNKLFHSPAVGVANARVSAADTLTIALFNTATTATAVGSGDYLIGATPQAPAFGIGASAYQSSAAIASTHAYMTYQVNPVSAQGIRDLRAAFSANGFLPS